MKSIFRAGLAAAAILAAVGGCSVFEEDEVILEGERIPVRATPADRTAAAGAAEPLTQPVANADWTQVNGSPTHVMGHLAAPAGLSRAWSVDIGAGGEQHAHRAHERQARDVLRLEKSEAGAFGEAKVRRPPVEGQDEKIERAARNRRDDPGVGAKVLLRRVDPGFLVELAARGPAQRLARLRPAAEEAPFAGMHRRRIVVAKLQKRPSRAIDRQDHRAPIVDAESPRADLAERRLFFRRRRRAHFRRLCSSSRGMISTKLQGMCR